MWHDDRHLVEITAAQLHEVGRLGGNGPVDGGVGVRADRQEFERVDRQPVVAPHAIDDLLVWQIRLQEHLPSRFGSIMRGSVAIEHQHSAALAAGHPVVARIVVDDRAAVASTERLAAIDADTEPVM